MSRLPLISALPPSTARLLGSSTTITSAPDLVKELVDNAIDAEATLISIYVSPNTLDKIQVRDNGHGISLDSLDGLGRRAHTSKLHDFYELREKFGKSLGFRGEALASANSLATVVITTRTADEPVASRVQIKFGTGGVGTRSPVSAPKGTTISVSDIFKNLPVRRENALKEAKKSLARMKEMLQAYVFARPHLKISLAVPGDAARSFAYTPSMKSSVKDAVLKIFGVDLVHNCHEVSLSVPAGDGGEADSTAKYATELKIEAFLPKPDCRFDVVNCKGAFVSVDSRPVSSSRGWARQAVIAVRSGLSQSFGTSLQTPRSPFLLINIRCPPGAYDANINALKDEVLFSSEKALIQKFQESCQKIYSWKNQSPGRDINLRDEYNRCVARPNVNSAQWRLPDIDNVKVSRVAQESPADIAEVNDDSENGEREGESCILNLEKPNKQPSKNDQIHRGEAPSVAQLRTVIHVNMGRQGSDATDGICTSGLLEVDLPPQPISSVSVLNFSQSQSAPEEMPRCSQRIERSVRPFHAQDIVIATDETATEARISPVNAEETFRGRRGPNAKRSPLRPISDSSLNCMRGPRSTPEARFAETDSQAPEDALENDSESDHSNAGHLVEISNVISRESRNAVFHSFMDSPLHAAAAREVPDIRGPSHLYGGAAPQTPPPSDRRQRRGDQRNLAFHPPGSQYLVPRTGEEMRSGRRESRQSARVADNRHPLLSFIPGWQAELGQGRVMPFKTSHDISASERGRGVVSNVRGLAGQSAAQAFSEDATQGYENFPARWPSPTCGLTTEDGRGMSFMDSTPKMIHHSSELEPTNASDCWAERGAHRLKEVPELNDEHVDGERGVSGQSERPKCRRLALEAVPHGQVLALTMRIKPCDVRQLMQEQKSYTELEAILAGDSLHFQSSSEAQFIKSRLRALVGNLWGLRPDEVDVDFTLRAGTERQTT